MAMSSPRAAAAIRLLLLGLACGIHLSPTTVDAFSTFSSPAAARRIGQVVHGASKIAPVLLSSADDTNEQQQPQQEEEAPNAVRAPLKYLGPYPCLSLRFPNLATSAQRARGANVTGISLDFVLDTAANTNTIQGAVAQELALEKVGEALPGFGAAGSISGGDTYLLGDCRLDYGVVMEEESSGDGGGGGGEDDDDDEQDFTFMQGLTASALPVASPAAAGLLGLYFFQCFQGGVMFEWGSNSAAASTAIPSITFFAERERMGDALDGLARAPIQPLPVSALPSINMIINGKTIPALLDTGSPITVVNAAAAKMAGVTTRMEDDGGGSNEKGKGNPFNPFAKLTKNFEAAQAAAQAAARGDVLLIAGADGKRVELVKSKDLVECGIVGDGVKVNIGKHNIYVGDLPGLAALGGLGGDGAPPAAVLGMDILRTRTRMVYRKDEVYL